jgi:hypothetical protein
MSETSGQGGPGYVDKKVSLHEEEQPVECLVPMFDQHPPSY